MGRGRKQYSHCVARRWADDQYPFVGDPDKGMVETWCGNTRSWDRAKPLESPRIATCLKCAQAIGKRGLAQNASRLRLEKRESPLAYDKSTYDVYIDGTLRAHVGIANGWGEKWYLAKLGDPDAQIHWTNGRHGGTVSGSVVDYFGHERISPDAVFWPVHFASRDAMACAALRYWDKHGAQGLPTEQERKQIEAERREREKQEHAEREKARQAAAVEREKREGERQERLNTWREALASLDARGDLTNLERAGIEAIKLLMP